MRVDPPAGGRLDRLDGTAGVEDRHGVADVLRRMPSQQARLLTLVYEWGFTHAEVGAMVGATPAAVKTAVWRARESFRSLYGGGADQDG